MIRNLPACWATPISFRRRSISPPRERHSQPASLKRTSSAAYFWNSWRRRADALVFKGGTCLAKVYAEFYRLSEDLDFYISTPATATRSQRSKQAAGIKKPCRVGMPAAGFQLNAPLIGANDSTHYGAIVGTRRWSAAQDRITLRSDCVNLSCGLHLSSARTMLLIPVSDRSQMVPALWSVHREN